MKKLILIFALALIGCSAEETEVNNELQYFLSLQEECMQGVITKHEVTEDLYGKVTRSHEVNDCAEWHRIPDISGEWHQGYLAAVETNDPKYQ